MKTKNLENIFVIGDVHGCYHTLMTLVDKLPKDAELIFVGDLCDKGNFSKEVIAFIKQNNYQAIKGNHDFLMQQHLTDSLNGKRDVPWSYDKRFGGFETIQSYESSALLAQEDVAWLAGLPLYVEIEDYFITHGFGLEFYEHKNNQDYEMDFLTNRYYKGMPLKEVSHTKINIFGHCVFDEVMQGENFYGIDTGCFNQGKLTAFQLGTHRLYEEPMDKKDSSYNLKTLTPDCFDLEKNSFEELSSLIIDENSRYHDYDLISNELLFSIVEKYECRGKREVIKMLQREQIFVKQAKRILGEEYEHYYEQYHGEKKVFTVKKERDEKYEELDVNRLIEMSWQDRITFDTIYKQYGLTENQLKNKMRTLLSKKGYMRWRKRVSDRKTKHQQKLDHKNSRFQGPW
ncbi:MAG: Serine/threonine protein phosphatase [uncultured Sulfurovum sp.]|uniref:Serine/threonine protein phosphatase n=1 Tax=uncultured Sulfurovum sp. TaxID=269237 RepID=A0A6S6TV50_9BACT|nr:MAG: Serine/threonine protein phosphatase [uncultured Sulfurovum sp.]